MALVFEQDPTIGAPDGKEWVRNTESGNVYAVDRETAQNLDIYEEPSAKAIASRYANQFEEGFRIGIPTGQTGDFEEELQEREVAFDESFDGEEETHYIFTSAEDYEAAENARKTLQTEIAMKLTEDKLRTIVREELQKVAKVQQKQQMNELSFREDKMRELLTREPKLERIRQEQGHSLKTMFDMYVVRNKEMKRQYKQASPQP